MSRRIKINPVTRLEGHGKIDIFLDDAGQVEKAFFRTPDFRGFEKFCEGRAVEELPALTQKICGVCPMAHHTASSKALDALFGVEPPTAAKKIREIAYNAFILEDHLLHFFFLGGPDLIAGPEAPVSKRTVFGVLEKLGREIGLNAIGVRKRIRGANAVISGSPLYPVNGLPGGIAKPLTEEERVEIDAAAGEAVEFLQKTLKLFHALVLKDDRFSRWLASETFSSRTYYMGLVDEQGRVNFYDGAVRVVDPDGNAVAEFSSREPPEYLEERVVPWSYQKMLYLKRVGWKGLSDGEDSGVYRVGPLARINVSEGMAAPLADEEYERLVTAMGGKPIHNALAYHWARLIEALYAAERMKELAAEVDVAGGRIRNLPRGIAGEGVGVCEAPRGTLIHHYISDDQGIAQSVNLLVATQHNAAAINITVEKAARAFIGRGEDAEAERNLVEMAFRAYDPCLACATH